MEKDKDFDFVSESKEIQVILKFASHAQTRLKNATFTSVSGTNLDEINDCFKKHQDIVISRLFDQTEEELERDVAKLKTVTGKDVPTLSCYYSFSAKNKKQANSIISILEKNDLVEEVYIEPPAVPAIFEEPAEILTDEISATPDFSAMQGYLKEAPEGINAQYAWTLDGGKGDKVQVIDIEGAWDFNHEDLLQNQGGVVGGTATNNERWRKHGTAVQGEIAGDENGFGIVGIASKSKFSAVSIFGSGNSSAKAIKTAADKLNKGDIILIELHKGGPNATGVRQFGYIAIEWWTADFDAVKYATAKGIIVIAAAGNGSQNLDDAIYEGKFDRNKRDSGAILVGAGAPPSGNFGPDLSRLSFSNYGKIIDAQGWGQEVTTTGYGDLQGGKNEHRHYTKIFNGTSSAAPIVVGAVACLQSIQKTRGGIPLTYSEVRNILRTTGSLQTDAPGRPKTQRIGNRPDIKAALAFVKPLQLSWGIASKYWIELIPVPTASPRLWLFVNGAWKRLDTPSANFLDIVQRAFLGIDSNVRVWYSGGTIRGLIVEGS